MITNYKEKYKELGVCVNHPRVRAETGYTQCHACIVGRRKGGVWAKRRRKWVAILGVRVVPGVLRLL